MGVDRKNFILASKILYLLFVIFGIVNDIFNVFSFFFAIFQEMFVASVRLLCGPLFAFFSPRWEHTEQNTTSRENS